MEKATNAQTRINEAGNYKENTMTEYNKFLKDHLEHGIYI